MLKHILLASALLIAVIAGASAQETGRPPSEAVHQQVVLSPVMILGKMEANLWKSTAAVMHHAADTSALHERIALDDFQRDVYLFDHYLAAAAHKLAEAHGETLNQIQQDWEMHKQLFGNALHQNPGARTDEHNRAMNEILLSGKKIDAAIDSLIDAMREG